jgi:hypothetical protein
MASALRHCLPVQLIVPTSCVLFAQGHGMIEDFSPHPEH